MSGYQRVLIFKALAYVAAGFAFQLMDFSRSSQGVGFGEHLGPIFFLLGGVSGFFFLMERIKGLEREVAALKGQDRPTG